jgi:hypothetical protein
MCEVLTILSHGSPMALAHLVLLQASMAVGASYLLLLFRLDDTHVVQLPAKLKPESVINNRAFLLNYIKLSKKL